MKIAVAPNGKRAPGSLDRAFARAGDGALAVAGNGRIILWNRAAQRILGYTERETLGRACCRFLLAWGDGGQELGCHGCHVVRLATNGDRAHNFDLRIKDKTGRSVRVNLSTLVVTNGRRAEGLVTVHLFHGATDALGPSGPATPGSEASPASPLARLLTAREIEVARLVVTGVTSRVAAKGLNVSGATVRNHVQHILTKLGLHSRIELVAYVLRNRLL